MKHYLLYLSAFLAVPAFAGYELIQPPLENDAMQVSIYRLDNGLTVYLTENHESPTFRSEITVRAGSRDDPADATGLAHYLEHLLFKGNGKLATIDWEKEKVHIDRITELYETHFNEDDPEERARIYQEINEESQLASQYAVPNEFDRLLSSFGASGMNAYTASDRTVYLEEMPANHLEQWARLEANRFVDPVFRLFQPELEIVYEEKNRSMDNKSWIMTEAISPLVYGEHPYGSQTAIGSIEHLKRPSLKKIHAFFDKHYIANNMAVAISGDIVKEEAIKVIDKYFSVLKSGEIPVFDRPMPAPIAEKKSVSFEYPGEEYVRLVFTTQPLGHEDVDALKMVDMILDNAAAGLINLNLNQQQAVLRAGSSPRFRNDAGVQTLWGIPKGGQTLEEVEALLLDQLEMVKKGEFEDWIIPAIIADFKKNEKGGLESNQGRLGTISSSFGSYLDWEYEVSGISRLEKVDKATVVKIANKYFNSPYVVAYRRNGDYTPPSVAKPEFDKIDIDRTRQSDFAKSVLGMDSSPIEPTFVEEGRDYQVMELRKGVRLFYSKNPVNDLFTLSRVYEMGTQQMRGLGLASALLDKSGTANFSPEKLKTRWYQLASNFGLSAGEFQTLVGIDGLAENFDESLALFEEVVSAPVSDQATLDQLIAIELKKRDDRKRDFQAIFTALRNYNRYGEKSPFLTSLTTEEVKAFSVEDLLGMVKGLSGYEHDYMYVGDLPIEEVAKKLRAIDDSSIALKTLPARENLRIRIADSNEVMYLDFETAQTQLRMEFTDGVYSEDLFTGIQFFNEYFYGGMSGIVFQEMREARALAYSVWAFYLSSQFSDGDSLVMGHIGTQADKTTDALAAYLELWDNMPESELRFEGTISSLESEYRVAKIGFRQVLSQVKAWERLEIEGDPRQARFDSAMDYSLEKLMAFYSDKIQGRAKIISILGPSTAIDVEKLAEYGELKTVTVDDIFVD